MWWEPGHHETAGQPDTGLCQRRLGESAADSETLRRLRCSPPTVMGVDASCPLVDREYVDHRLMAGFVVEVCDERNDVGCAQLDATGDGHRHVLAITATLDYS